MSIAIVADEGAPLFVKEVPEGMTVIATTPATAIRQVSAAIASGAYSGFLSVLTGSPIAENAADADAVGRFLHNAQVKYAGVPARCLKFSRGDLAMLGFYSDCEIFVAPHRVISLKEFIGADRNMTAQSLGLNYPVEVGTNYVYESSFEVRSDSELTEALKSAFSKAAEAFVAEIGKSKEAPATVVHGDAFFVEAPSDSRWQAQGVPTGQVKLKFPDALSPSDVTEIENRIRGLHKDMFGKPFGFASYRLAVATGHEKAPNGVHIQLLAARPNDPTALTEVLCSSSPSAFTEWLKCCLTVTREKEVLWSMQYDPFQRGYFVRASREVKKGEIVFDDEAKPQVIVTKPFVQKNWNAVDRETFSRYAWPLDSAGHCYAMWQEEPRLWRPINHSCDPNVVFDAPHSLNGVASRDIPKGEALTLDYTTFCDFTMKPFQCFCGTAKCRGTVTPNEAALAQYGQNAWHRRMPEKEETFATGNRVI